MNEPHPDAAASVVFQTVLYQTSYDAVERTLEALNNSARIGKRDIFCSRFEVLLGDASPVPVLNEINLRNLREQCPDIDAIVYREFGENTGTSRGHNLLAPLSQCDFMVLANPDVVVDALAMWRMVTVFNDRKVGMVEAKQLPVEHPKDYDQFSGFTSWASGAFSMIRRETFAQVDGYDETSFFLYCDDVDLSWRVRELGLQIVFQPAAVVFHDKSLTVDGGWLPTPAEHYFSAQAALLLRHKWSRPDLVEEILGVFDESDMDEHRKAAVEFRRRRESGELVEQRDAGHQVAVFVDNNYALHRYPL